MQHFLAIRKQRLCVVLPTGTSLAVDFNDLKLYQRLQQGSRFNLLIKALGLHKRQGNIIDATAGLGQDSFIAAGFGANVYMFERNPYLSLILQDGLERARLSNHKQAVAITNKMHLINQDASTCASLGQMCIDLMPICIYLDPMYPKRAKSALGKQQLRYLTELVGCDEDANLLFAKAITLCNRVVVKRPKLAPTIVTSPKPALQMFGKSTRFDIYLQ